MVSVELSLHRVPSFASTGLILNAQMKMKLRHSSNAFMHTLNKTKAKLG